VDDIRNAISMPIQWVQPKVMHPQYELRAREQVCATMVIPKWYQPLAQAESVDGQWTFERVGSLNPRVLIRRAGEGTKLGMYVYTQRGEGRLELASGAQYRWKSTNLWATQFNWLQPNDQPLIHYRLGVQDNQLSDWFKIQSRVQISPEAAQLPELYLLVLLGWYLMLLGLLETALVVAASDWRIFH
jgi:hypothetical protein